MNIGEALPLILGLLLVPLAVALVDSRRTDPSKVHYQCGPPP